MSNSEITSHVSSKIYEFKVDLNLHIRQTIEQVISDQVIPTVRETLSKINSGARPNVDLTSSERHSSPEMHYLPKVWGKMNKSDSNQNRHNTENSFERQSTAPEFITGRPKKTYLIQLIPTLQILDYLSRRPLTRTHLLTPSTA